MEIEPRQSVPTILLVEDEDQVRALTRTVLENGGYRVLEAREADEAMSLCDRVGGEIDLLITDVVLPGMSGTQLSREIQIKIPGLPVLLVSGYPENGELELGPGVHFLQKPYRLDSLLDKTRRILEQA